FKYSASVAAAAFVSSEAADDTTIGSNARPLSLSATRGALPERAPGAAFSAVWPQPMKKITVQKTAVKSLGVGAKSFIMMGGKIFFRRQSGFAKFQPLGAEPLQLLAEE